MVKAVLFTLLFIVLVAALFYFVFLVLYPALKKQRVDVRSPLLSDYDVSAFKPFILKGTEAGPVTEDGKSLYAVIEKKEDCVPMPEYYGLNDCNLFHKVYDSEAKSFYGCFGFGNCVKACPRNSISIINDKAVIDASCNGCGKCLSACPQGLISLFSEESKKTEFLKKDFQFWQKCYRMLRRKKE